LVWYLRDVKAGRYAIFMDAALATDYQGRPFVLDLGDERMHGTVEFTHGLNRFRQRKFGDWRLGEDQEELTIRFFHELNGPQMSLREIRLAPAE
jgi:hypothetical protein